MFSKDPNVPSPYWGFFSVLMDETHYLLGELSTDDFPKFCALSFDNSEFSSKDDF